MIDLFENMSNDDSASPQVIPIFTEMNTDEDNGKASERKTLSDIPILTPCPWLWADPRRLP